MTMPQDAYDNTPEVTLVERCIGTPFSSRPGVILNACNVDETIEKRMLSLKNRPGQILEKMKLELGLVLRASRCEIG